MEQYSVGKPASSFQWAARGNVRCKNCDVGLLYGQADPWLGHMPFSVGRHGDRTCTCSTDLWCYASWPEDVLAPPQGRTIASLLECGNFTVLASYANPCHFLIFFMQAFPYFYVPYDDAYPCEPAEGGHFPCHPTASAFALLGALSLIIVCQNHCNQGCCTCEALQLVFL